MPRADIWKRRTEEYLAFKSDQMRSSKTLSIYRSVLRQAWMYAVKKDWPHPKLVSRGQLREYYESAQHFSTSTQQLYVGTLIEFLIWSGNDQMRDVSFGIKVCRSRVNWLAPEEIGLLIKMAERPQLRGAVAVMAYTGIRVGELSQLRTADLTNTEMRIRGKGRKERVIPLDQEFWDAIRPYSNWKDTQQDSEFFLFHVYRGSPRPYPVQTLDATVKEHGQRFGIHVTPHTLRRSFGRHLYLNGCPLAQLSVLMGHSKLETTLMYLGIGDYDIQAAMKFRPSYTSQERKMSKSVPGGVSQ